jgi:hypothetical protein
MRDEQRQAHEDFLKQGIFRYQEACVTLAAFCEKFQQRLIGMLTSEDREWRPFVPAKGEQGNPVALDRDRTTDRWIEVHRRGSFDGVAASVALGAWWEGHSIQPPGDGNPIFYACLYDPETRNQRSLTNTQLDPSVYHWPAPEILYTIPERAPDLDVSFRRLIDSLLRCKIAGKNVRSRRGGKR